MTAPYQLRIKINYDAPRQSFGSTEDYWLVGASTAAACYAAAQLICQYRVLFLAPGPVGTDDTGNPFYTTGPYIQYASVSQYGNPRDSLGIDVSNFYSYPNNTTVAVGTIAPPNDRTSAIEYRFIATNGHQGSRLFRYIPDSWEADIQAAPGFTPPAMYAVGTAIPTIFYTNYVDPNGQPYVDTVATGNSPAGLRAYFLNVLQQETGFATLSEGPPPTGTVTPIGLPTNAKGLPIIFTTFSGHRTGRPYGDYAGRAKKSY